MEAVRLVLAPEVIRDDPDVVDVWGVGLVLYAMLTGELPFGAETEAGRRDSTAGSHCATAAVHEDSHTVQGTS